jgi:hypothetical protein
MKAEIRITLHSATPYTVSEMAGALVKAVRSACFDTDSAATMHVVVEDKELVNVADAVAQVGAADFEVDRANSRNLTLSRDTFEVTLAREIDEIVPF